MEFSPWLEEAAKALDLVEPGFGALLALMPYALEVVEPKMAGDPVELTCFHVP